MGAPTYEQIADAVRRSGEHELNQLLSGPDSIVVRREALPDVAHHDVHRVLFTETDHPMSFWLAVPHAGTSPLVLSRNIAGVHAFLAAEPALLAAADLPRRFHELYRHQGLRSAVQAEPAPRVERGADGVRIDMSVEVDGERERWTVVLPTSGAPSIKEGPAPQRRP